jgi:chemotaxis protein MotA
MDISTGLGLAFGGFVLVSLILMGGDLRMFLDARLHRHFGGSTAATLIRFPVSIMHGLPLGMKFVFNMRRWTSRDLVDEIASAEVARKQGPIGLKKRTSRIRSWPRDALRGRRLRHQLYPRQPRTRPRQFLIHLDEGQKIYRAIGDCARPSA